MKKMMTELFALRGLLVGLSLLILFHLLVLMGVVPFEVVWGGKMSEVSQMQRLEAVSAFFSLIMLSVVALRARIIKAPISSRIVTIMLWVMFAFFCLNTLGNLLSENLLEKLIFAPVTLLLALFTYRVVRSRSR